MRYASGISLSSPTTGNGFGLRFPAQSDINNRCAIYEDRLWFRCAAFALEAPVHGPKNISERSDDPDVFDTLPTCS